MPPEYKVTYSPAARADISDIYDGIAQISSPYSADKWTQRIVARAGSLNVMPERYPAYPLDSTKRSTNVGKYKIIYEVLHQPRLVQILRILYARRNLRHWFHLFA